MKNKVEIREARKEDLPSHEKRPCDVCKSARAKKVLLTDLKCIEMCQPCFEHWIETTNLPYLPRIYSLHEFDVYQNSRFDIRSET